MPTLETADAATATATVQRVGHAVGLTGAPELLTVSQAAKCLGIGRSTLYRLLSESSLPLTRVAIGRDTRLAKRELMAWLESPGAEPTRVRGPNDELIRLRRRRAL
jgi:excisionase family DNA binding protein